MARVVNGRQYLSDALAVYIACDVKVASDPATPEWITCYTHDRRVLAVRETPKAKWLAWGEGNLIAKRAGRAQRTHLAAVKAEITGANEVAALDPTGAYRAVAARLQEERETLALPDADEAAQAQVEARAEAEEPRPRRREKSIYRRMTEVEELAIARLRGEDSPRTREYPRLCAELDAELAAREAARAQFTPEGEAGDAGHRRAKEG